MDSNTKVKWFRAKPPRWSKDGLATISEKNCPPGRYDLSKRRIAMNTAVYKVPPSPSKLNGAKEFRLFKEQSGKRTKDDNNIMTLDRSLKMDGRLNVYFR